MTDQELFDRVVTHLRTQGRPAKDGWGVCNYRAPDGCKCAIGALIPDETYDEVFEGCALQSGTPRSWQILDAAGIANHQWALAVALQRAHDTAPYNTSDDWLAKVECQLVRIAAFFGLTYTPPAGAPPEAP